MDTNQRLWVKMCMLLVWSTLMLSALVLVGADDVKTTDQANVVAYWERKLHGAIPSSIRAMVTPLSSQQATQLLINITAMTTYFPNHAATFCKAARIKCVKDVKEPSSQYAISFFYHSDHPSSKNAIPFYQSDKPSSKNAIPFYHSNDPSSKNVIPFYHSNDPSSKNVIPFYQSKDPSSKNLIPFYHSDDVSSKNLIPFYQSDDPSSKNLIPFYHSDEPSSKNLIPFYHSDDPSPKNLIPFYQSDGSSSKNAIPFYHSVDPSSNNAIPFYQSDDPSSKNLIPFYHSDDSSSKNAIPFYQSDDRSSKNAIPFYHSDDPSSKNLIPFYHSDDPSSKNLIPFYQPDDPSSKNLIPFYQSDDPPIMQNDASTKKPNIKARSQAFDKISSEVPRFLISPTIHEIRNAFREKQVLVSGKEIYIGLSSDRHGVDERAFLPRKLARLFPLDNEGSKIESMLEISKEYLLQTIHICEAQSKNDYLHAEVKACLTSLEDVVDFVTNIMGSSKPIKVYDSLFNASSVKFVGKTFTVLNVELLKQDPDEPSVSCHDMDFPFRMFYCHYAKQTKSFVATLQARDGSIHERIANCHYDTSYWNPQHVAFQDLQTKPGDGEICHWLGRTWMEQDGWLFLHA